MGHEYFNVVVPINTTERQMKSVIINTVQGWSQERETSFRELAKKMSVRVLSGNNTEEEAKAIFYGNDDFYWEGFIKAIPFYKTAKTKAMKEFEQKIVQTTEKMKKYRQEHRIGLQKAEFIGCPSCRSKINKIYFVKKLNYVGPDICPVCNHDLASDTVKKTLAGYDKKITEYINAIECEKKKQQGKPTHYLVVCGFHV